jgi:hypothetical protein
MSKYIEKIEQDYNDGNITLAEITKLREDYNKLSAYDKGNLEIKYGKKEVDSKNNKPQPKVNYQEQVVNLLKQQNSDISTIKGIMLFYLLLFIISIIVSLTIINS